jgi:hypothetical protein
MIGDGLVPAELGPRQCAVQTSAPPARSGRLLACRAVFLHVCHTVIDEIRARTPNPDENLDYIVKSSGRRKSALPKPSTAAWSCSRIDAQIKALPSEQQTLR